MFELKFKTTGEYKFTDETLDKLDAVNSSGLINKAFDMREEIIAEFKHDIEVHGTV